MAATSEQMVMPSSQDLKHTLTTHTIKSASSHDDPTTTTTTNTTTKTPITHNKAHSLSGTSIRSERRPSFSITLPPSCSRSSHLASRSLVFNTLAGPDDDNDSTAGFEEALALQQEANGASDNSNHKGLQPLDPPVRRRSIQFISGEDDSLAKHEGKNGLPKTPYPVTEEQDLEIQHSLFSKH
ncbi:hypothetical protein BGW39_000952 [Mortierella sp. 14UC]|nr:hypothetical protein BGW39_000952 [Mortierella sp. 14UC]